MLRNYTPVNFVLNRIVFDAICFRVDDKLGFLSAIALFTFVYILRPIEIDG